MGSGRCGLQTSAVKFGNKAFGRSFTFLKKPVFYAYRAGEFQYPLIFRGSDSPAEYGSVRLRKPRQMFKRRILIHDTDIYVISIRIVKISQDSLGIGGLAGKE